MSAHPARFRARLLAGVIVMIALVVAGLTPLSAAASSTTSPTVVFDQWTTTVEGGADVRFAADTSIRHGGGQSVRIADSTPVGAGAYGVISQSLAVKPSTQYVLTVWVRSEAARAGSAFIVYGSGAGDYKSLPGGTTGWQKLRWIHTTTATDTVIPFAIVVQDASTYWFDDITVVARKTGSSVIVNGGFEESENLISIGADSMFFAPGAAEIPIASPTESVTWTVRDEADVVVGSGTADTSSGAAVLDFSGYGPGYYALDLAGTDAARSTSFAIIEGLDNRVDAVTSRFGTTLHPMVHPGVEQAGMVQDVGFGQVRLDLRWEAIEKVPGVYEWDPVTDAEVDRLVARGIRPVLVAAYYGPYDDGRTPHSAEGIAGYAAFVGAAAAHYGSDVDIEVYNEYNFGYSNSLCGQTPACYMQLLAPASEAIRAAAPGVRVIGPVIGGLTSWWLTTGESYDWLAEFFALGGLEHIDLVSVHNYGTPAAPEGHNERVVARIKDLMAEYPAADGMPLWLTETGYQTIGVEAGGVTELMQARYLVRDAALSLAQDLDVYMVYGMLDDWPEPENPEANFGLVRNPAGQMNLLAPKPAFVAHAVLNRQLEGRDFAGRDTTPDGSHSLVFASPGAEDLRIMWATTDGSVGATASGPVTVTDQFGKVRTVAPVDGRVELALTQDAVYVTGPDLALEPIDEARLAAPADSGPLVAFIPVSDATSTESAGAAVRVIDPASAGMSVDEVVWTLGSRSGAETPGTVLDADGVATVALPVDDRLLWTPMDYSATVALSSGATGITEGRTAFAPVEPTASTTFSHADLAASGTWVELGGGHDGPLDLSGAMWVSWTSTALTVHAVVLDQKHVPADTAETMRSADSIRFGIDTWPNDASTVREFGAALIDGSAVVYDFTDGGSAVGSAAAAITRDDARGTTNYAISLSWAELGLSALPPYLAYSFLVNDHDGADLDGYLEWGSGVGGGKDAAKYLPLQIVG